MGDSYRPSEDHKKRNQNRNQNRGGNGRGPKKNPRRRPEPPKKKTFLQKVLGFFGIGKSDEKVAPQSKGKSAKSKSPRDRKPRERKPVEITSGRMFVGNLNYDVDDAALAEHFKVAGDVKSAEVVTNPHNGKSKGFGFVEMSSLEEAKKAAELLRDQDFMGRRLLVSGAKSDGKKTGGDRRERPDRGDKSSRGGERGGRGEGRDGRGGRNDQRGGRSSGGRDKGGRKVGRKSQEEARVYEAVKPIDIEQVSGPGLALENLASGFSDDDLKDLFEGIGTVSGSELGDGTAQVLMASTEEAQDAVKLLHAKKFMGKVLKVKGAEVTVSEDAPAPTPVVEEQPSAPESNEATSEESVPETETQTAEVEEVADDSSNEIAQVQTEEVNSDPSEGPDSEKA